VDFDFFRKQQTITLKSFKLDEDGKPLKTKNILVKELCNHDILMFLADVQSLQNDDDWQEKVYELAAKMCDMKVEEFNALGASYTMQIVNAFLEVNDDFFLLIQERFPVVKNLIEEAKKRFTTIF
jgi:hypothetical protein